MEISYRTLGVGGDGVGRGVPRDLGDLGGGIDKVGGYGGRRVDWGSTLQPVSQEKLCVVLANGLMRDWVNRECGRYRAGEH